MTTKRFPTREPLETLERGVLDGCSPWTCCGDTGPEQDDFGLAF